MSNPPWLTLSKIAGNPYREALKKKAKPYGVLPQGSAFLHVELATIFALNGVDRYLANNGVFGMIMPSTLLNGKHHEPFRQSKYAQSSKRLQMSVDEVWQLPNTLFKNKAIAIFGAKGCMTKFPIKGRVYTEAAKFTPSQYKVALKNTAWIPLDENTVEVEASDDNYKTLFTEGADLMPRTALFHAMEKANNGTWRLRPIDKSCDLWYLLSDAKKFPCKDLDVDGFLDDFVYSALISKHISPFYVAPPAAMILPGRRIGAQYSPLTDTDYAGMNAATAATFRMLSEIDAKRWDIQKYFTDKIDIYGKLRKQHFTGKGYLVLSSAGGENPCAGYIKLSPYLRKKLVVDQTLYWYMASLEEEAIFLVGMLNSEAMAMAIKVYQPEGEQGRRHIHTIPYSLIPIFDQNNAHHKQVVLTTKKLMDCWASHCKNGELSNLLHPNSSKLNSRRKIQQDYLKKMSEYADYNEACSQVLHAREIPQEQQSKRNNSII